MAFLWANAFWFLLLVPLAVLLYLLRLKRRRQEVPSLMFWQQVLRDAPSAKLFQKLRQILSLLLQIAIIALVVLALARPVPKRFAEMSVSRVLIVDTSASMKAKEAQTTRFGLARDAARRWISQASGIDQTLLMTAGRQPKVACPFSADEKILLESLSKIRATDTAGDLEAAIAQAETILRGRDGRRQIVVLTDHPVEAKVGQGVELGQEQFGSPRDNVGILRWSTRPSLESPETREIYFSVKNFGRRAVDTQLEVTLDGALLDVKPLHLEPGERVSQTFPTLAGRAGILKARLMLDDALAADNVAYAPLPEARRRKILLITAGNLFLEKALRSDALVDLIIRLPSEIAGGIPKDSAAVVIDSSANARDLGLRPENLPPSWWIGQVPGVASAGETEKPLVSDIAASHPLVRLVSFRGVTLVKMQRFDPEAIRAQYSGWTIEAPVRSFDQPLILAAQNGLKRWVSWTFDPLQSDLPLRVAFPLLVSNTIQWLTDSGSAAPPAYLTGEVVPLRAGEKLASGESGFFMPVDVGLYEARGSEGTRWIAANLFDERESALAGVSGGRGSLPRRWAAAWVRPLWVYLAWAGALLLLLEWWWWNRRVVA
ncbi:MAG: BatA and WFA domain-containing protein [Verrucomicrobiae bacterium]|nr:BatA and WFA domain-containing protein [Verrucomicrobiae bacterium]